VPETALGQFRAPTRNPEAPYDVVLEEAIRFSNVPVLTGRTNDTQPTLDTSLWDVHAMDVSTLESQGRLTKLHGSIDWVRGQDKIHVGTPLFQGRHERHAIIYPGFKGAPNDPLFQHLHQYCRSRLAKASGIIIIGYAFRDEYINTILSRDLRRDAMVIVLNPAERLPSMPFAESRVVHIRLQFGRQGAEAVLAKVGSLKQ
jgi:hypothetical protein